MSPITRIAVECWIGQGRRVIQQESPTHDDLQRLFARLNGSSEDTLSLETDTHDSLLTTDQKNGPRFGPWGYAERFKTQTPAPFPSSSA